MMMMMMMMVVVLSCIWVARLGVCWRQQITIAECFLQHPRFEDLIFKRYGSLHVRGVGIALNGQWVKARYCHRSWIYHKMLLVMVGMILLLLPFVCTLIELDT